MYKKSTKKLLSVGLAMVIILLISFSGDNRIVPAFSDNVPPQVNTSSSGVDDNNDGFPPTTESDNTELSISNTGTVSPESPVSDNAQGEPVTNIVALDTTSDDTTTISASGSSDGDANTDSLPHQSGEDGLNSNGSSSSQTGISGNLGDGGLPTANEGSSPSIDSSSQNNQIPTESPQTPGADGGSTGTLPSNGTIAGDGITNVDPISDASNQSAVGGTVTGENASSTEPEQSASFTNTSSPDSNSASSSLDGELQAASPSDEASLQAAADISSISDDNTVSQPISLGDDQGISLGDVSNTGNVSATFSFDKSSYSVGDTAQLTVTDVDGNVDPTAVNTIQVFVNSTGDPTGIGVTLTETGPNTGQFVGTFDLTAGASTDNAIKVDTEAGDQIHLFYDSTHPRVTAELDQVIQPGTVQIKEVTIPNDEFPDVLVGNAVELTLGDGALLAPNDYTAYCQEGGVVNPVDTCTGSITLTMSYANTPLTGTNQDPNSLTIFQKVGGSWKDIRDFGTIIIDENAKTVTAVTPFGPGIFSIGANTGGSGGGGGAVGFPGAGIVLDFLAPVSAPTPTPPSPQPSPASPTTTTSTDTTDKDDDDDDDETTGSQNPDTTTTNSNATSSAQEKVISSSTSGSEDNSEARTRNVTISVPGEGNVTLVFEGLVSEGNLSATPVKSPSDTAALKIEKETADMQGSLSTLNNTNYTTVGTVFVIGPSDARFNDTITVSIPYDAAQVGQGQGQGQEGSEVRILQYTGSSWQDVTTTPPADARSVTGSIATLGPVVAAVRTN